MNPGIEVLLNHRVLDPLVKMTCLVTLRTDIFWELVHRNYTPLAPWDKEMAMD